MKKLAAVAAALGVFVGLSALTTGCMHRYGYGPGVVVVHHYGYGSPSVVHVYHGGYGGYGSGTTVTHVYHNGYGGVSHVVVHHYR